MPAWPATLPRPLVDDYELQPVDRVIRTQMDAGNTRSRRRFTSSPTKIPVSWNFNRGQMAVFEAFHALDLLDGQASFDVDLFNGDDVTSYSAKFVQIWKGKLKSGLRWRVAAILEVQSRPLLSAAQLEVAKTYPAEDIFYTAPKLHQLLHVDMPATYWVTV